MMRVRFYLGILMSVFLMSCGFSEDVSAGKKDKSDEKVTLKIASYNIFTSDARKNSVKGNPEVSEQRYWGNSCVAVADAIVDIDCDVIGFQEVCDSIWGRRGDCGIQKLVADRGGKYEWFILSNSNPKDPIYGKINYATALAWKKDKFSIMDYGIYWIAGYYDQPKRAADAEYGSSNRHCLWVKLKEKKSGKKFYYMTTHFSVTMFNDKNDNTKRIYYPKAVEDNARYLVTYADEVVVPKDVPSIIVGDMNLVETAQEDAYNTLVSRRWADAYYIAEAKGGLGPSVTGCRSSVNNKDEKTLAVWKPDHIFVDGVEVLSYDVCQKKYPTRDGTLHYPSDHMPVIAEISF
ncbi:MAG: endonuclease/exonuclease/phosphatase family protein [Bacteroidales bacterium]|nr:endonuclease/exonuclease/phosphatase family protein [Bacteroidales bacterium]